MMTITAAAGGRLLGRRRRLAAFDLSLPAGPPGVPGASSPGRTAARATEARPPTEAAPAPTEARAPPGAEPAAPGAVPTEATPAGAVAPTLAAPTEALPTEARPPAPRR